MSNSEQEIPEWKGEFAGIKTRKDAAKFMTSAKIKVYFGGYVRRTVLDLGSE